MQNRTEKTKVSINTSSQYPSHHHHHPTSEMGVPQLPPEIWFRVAQFTTPETLASLSEVNREFNQLVTHQSHYRTHAPSAFPQTPVQAFRRRAALFHSPTLKQARNPSLRLVYTAVNTSLFFDISKQNLVAFPKAYVFTLFKRGNPATVAEMHRTIISRIVPMVDDFVGIIIAKHSSLRVLNLHTGISHDSPLMVPAPHGLPITRTRDITLAGDNGKLTVQRVENGLLAFFDWNTGLASRPPIHISRDSVFMFGENPRSHEPPLVGTALESRSIHSQWKRLFIKSINLHPLDFKMPSDASVKFMLRSRDERTFVLFVTKTAQLSRPTHFTAFRLRENDPKAWFSRLPSGMNHAQLRENGDIIIPTYPRYPNQRSPNVTRWPVCIFLNETNHIQGTVETVFVKRLNRCPPPIWSRVTPHEIFLVIVGRSRNKIELVQLQRQNNSFKEIVLTTLVIEGLTNVSVVADHYILATDRSQKLHMAHFDKFCNGASGVYACPLVGHLSPRFFPDAARSDDLTMSQEPRSNRVKRRRTDDRRLRNAVHWE